MKLTSILTLALLQMCAGKAETEQTEIQVSELQAIKKDTIPTPKEEKVVIDEKTYLKVTYEEVVNIPQELLLKLPSHVQKEFLKPVRYTLIYDGNQSKYYMEDKNVAVSVDDEFEPENKHTYQMVEFAVFKDYPNKKFILKTSLNNEEYLVDKDFYSEKWILKKEVKKIGNFNCKKAEITLSGETITAFYTEDIPVREGPSRYFGLPGLIVYLEAPDRNYSLVKVENPKELKIEKFKVGIPIREEDFQKIEVQEKIEIREFKEK